MARKNGHAKATKHKELVEETIPIQLNDGEREKVADEASTLYEKLTKKQSEFKEVKKKWTRQISEVQAQFDSKMRAYSEGFEFRTLKCEKIVDGDEVSYVVDGVVVHQREATDLDRQFKMPFATKSRKNVEIEATV